MHCSWFEWLSPQMRIGLSALSLPPQTCPRHWSLVSSRPSSSLSFSPSCSPPRHPHHHPRPRHHHHLQWHHVNYCIRFPDHTDCSMTEWSAAKLLISWPNLKCYWMQTFKLWKVQFYFTTLLKFPQAKFKIPEIFLKIRYSNHLPLSHFYITRQD